MTASRPAGPESPLSDSSLHGILVGNLITFVTAIVSDWSVGPLLWVYWGQSIVIGIANVIRMLRLEEFSTAGFTSNGQQVPENAAGKRSTATFFAFHYGFFHVAYFVFLAAGAGRDRLGPSDWLGVTVSVLGFAGAHGYSLWFNQGRDFKDQKPNLGAIMFYPYLRIIPMHLTIILGSAVAAAALPLFIGLKTLSDVGMHAVEHALFRRGAAPPMRGRTGEAS